MEEVEDKEVKEDDEKEPEVEYVERYDELEEAADEDIEDFAGFMKDESLKGDDLGYMDEDGEEPEPSDKLTGKKRSKGSDSGKVDDDGHPTKLKRKGRVTIERACVVGILTRHDFMPEHILGLHSFLRKSKRKRLRFRRSTLVKYIRGILFGHRHNNWNSVDSE